MKACLALMVAVPVVLAEMAHRERVVVPAVKVQRVVQVLWAVPVKAVAVVRAAPLN